MLQKHGSTEGMSPIGSPCIIPFIYKGKSWKQCISVGSGSSLHWCSTQVSEYRNPHIHSLKLLRLIALVIMFWASGVTAALHVLCKNLNHPLHPSLRRHQQNHQVSIISNQIRSPLTYLQGKIKLRKG